MISKTYNNITNLDVEEKEIVDYIKKAFKNNLLANLEIVTVVHPGSDKRSSELKLTIKSNTPYDEYIKKS